MRVFPETKTKLQFLAVLILTAALAVVVARPQTLRQVAAQTVDNLKNQQQALQEKLGEIQRRIDGFQGQIAETRKQSNTLKNQISIFDNQISSLQLQIEANNTRLEDTNLQIKETQEQIARRQAEIAESKKILGQLIVELHEMDQNSLLYMGLGNDNFSAFLDQVQYVQNVQGKVYEILQNIKTIKAKLEQQEAELKAQLARLEELKEQLDQTQASLDQERAQRQRILDQTRGVERNFQNLLAASKSEEDKLYQEINDLDNAIRAKLGNLAPPRAAGALLMPMNGVLTQRYGRTGFTALGYNFHNGLDIAAPPGTPIYAAADGIVHSCDTGQAAYGNWCTVKHSLTDGRQIVTLYAHMRSFKVKGGQQVRQGDIIGYEGNTGNTTRLIYGPERGYHLHFTVFDAQGFGIAAGAHQATYGPYRVPYGYTYDPMTFVKR